jgi:Ser/Thr protein kinase RdoA (MazF antagonist)
MEVFAEFLNGLGGRLSELFGIGRVTGIEPMHGGLLCQNFNVETETGRYFLKQYRKQTSTWVYEIKFAEQYFASNDVPVILPLKDDSERSAFWHEDNWYSLFPFVSGIQKDSEQLTPGEVMAMGKMLAKIHRGGVHFSGRDMPFLKMWDRGRFLLEYVDIRRALDTVKEPDELDALARETLDRKYKFVTRNSQTPQDFDLPRNCLLHGDFHHGNVFFDAEGNVTHVFDLEKTSVGPRSFELGRSLMIVNFDTGFETANVEKARAFLKAYREEFPISFEEFHKGMRVYTIDLAHVLWMEAKRYLKHSKQYDRIYRSHAMRIKMLSEDIRPFCERLYR